jgi:hypothetical protein
MYTSWFDDPGVREFMIHVIRRVCLLVAVWIEKRYKLKED